ncbi:MAG: M1 family metallopeptidase [Eubacteriales bacterium]|nr:M1 family metallopeptidase [Eubacteriales bacterium]
MKKRVLLVLLALLCTAGGVCCLMGGRESSRALVLGEPVRLWAQAQDLCAYALEMEVDPRAHTARAELQVTYRNNESCAMEELHFLLYANSYSRQDYQIFEAAEQAQAYPNGFSPGGIAVRAVTAAGEALPYTIAGEQEQVLKVELGEALPPGGQTALCLEYTLTIPNCYGRFGYGDNTLSLANCTPILAVYDDNGWHDYPYYAVGDPFYSDAADYTARVTLPTGYTLASGGVTDCARRGTKNVWTVQAPARRDIAFVISNGFDVTEGAAGNVCVKSYSLRGQEEAGERALRAACRALCYYEQRFGAYPYGVYSVVQTDFFIGGMEYPGMALIDARLYEPVLGQELEYVTAHETAHMWWYAAVGSDQVYEPWLDEALTEYAAREYTRVCAPDAAQAMEQNISMMRQYRAGTPGAVNLPVQAFEGNLDYSAWVYEKGADVMEALRLEMDAQEFDEALCAYYQENRLGLTDRAAFESVFSRGFGAGLDQWLDEAFRAP